MAFKLVISDPESGRSIQKEGAPEGDKELIGMKIGDSVKGDRIELPGYDLQITGGSDYCGFPMRKDVEGARRKRILAYQGIGVKKSRKGMRQRKTVCGNTVHEKIVQINLKVVKHGSDNVFEKKEESSKEAGQDDGSSKKEGAVKEAGSKSGGSVNPEDKKVEDKKVEDKKVEDKKVEDKKVEDKKVEDKKVEDKKVEDKKVEDKKVEDKKVEDKKVEDKKVEDKKVEDKKVEDKKVEDKKVEDKKVEG